MRSFGRASLKNGLVGKPSKIVFFPAQPLYAATLDVRA